MANIMLTQEHVKRLFPPWWLYLLFGLNLVFLSVLIILFPDLLSLMVSAFLMMDGVVLLALSFTVLYKDIKAKKQKPVRQSIVID